MNHPPAARTLPSRVLVRGVNWLGDAVMTMPAVRRLREAMPADGHLAVLVHAKVADLWRNNPSVDEIITIDHRKSELAQAREIRKHKFQLAVIFPNSLRSALVPFLAGIPRRAGYHGHRRRALLTESFKPDPLFATRPRLALPLTKALGSGEGIRGLPSPPKFRHQVLHYLELVAKLDASGEPCEPRIVLTDAEIAATEKLFPKDPRPILGVAPCAEYGQAKRWSPDRYVEAIRSIRAKMDCKLIMFGSASDRRVCKTIAGKVNAASSSPDATVLAGQTTLRDLCACLSRCSVLLTNDTGPMHLAVAVGTPVIAIFGSTDPALTGPNYPGCPAGAGRHTVIRHQTDCSPCFLRECPIDFRCMDRIQTEEVAAAVLRRWRAS